MAAFNLEGFDALIQEWVDAENREYVDTMTNGVYARIMRRGSDDPAEELRLANEVRARYNLPALRE